MTRFRPFAILAHHTGRALGRWTPAGRFLLALYGASLFFVMDVRRTTNHQLFALLLSLLVTATILGLARRGRFRIERRAPLRVEAGTVFAYSLDVTNLSAHGVGDVELEERLDAAVPRLLPPKKDRHGPCAAGTGLGPEALRFDAPTIERIPAGKTARVLVRALASRRGVIRFSGTTVAVPDPLGLFRSRFFEPGASTTLVLPKRVPAPRLRLTGRPLYQSGGPSRVSAAGDSQEFAGLRDWRPGDPLRMISWKAFARRDEPVVKEFREEYFSRIGLVLDTFLPFAGPGRDDEAAGNRFEAAVTVAASLCTAERDLDSLLDLVFIAERAVVLTQGRGLAAETELLEALAQVEPCRDATPALLTRTVAAHAEKLSAAVVILLAWDAERAALVEAVKKSGAEARFLLVWDHDKTGAPDFVHRIRVDRLAEDLEAL